MPRSCAGKHTRSCSFSWVLIYLPCRWKTHWLSSLLTQWPGEAGGHKCGAEFQRGRNCHESLQTHAPPRFELSPGFMRHLPKALAGRARGTARGFVGSRDLCLQLEHSSLGGFIRPCWSYGLRQIHHRSGSPQSLDPWLSDAGWKVSVGNCQGKQRAYRMPIHHLEDHGPSMCFPVRHD